VACTSPCATPTTGAPSPWPGQGLTSTPPGPRTAARPCAWPFMGDMCESKVSCHRLLGVELIGKVMCQGWFWRDAERGGVAHRAFTPSSSIGEGAREDAGDEGGSVVRALSGGSSIASSKLLSCLQWPCQSANVGPRPHPTGDPLDTLLLACCMSSWYLSNSAGGVICPPKHFGCAGECDPGLFSVSRKTVQFADTFDSSMHIHVNGPRHITAQDYHPRPSTTSYRSRGSFARAINLIYLRRG